MAKSLKEALLEKFSDLQELGIAPTNAPTEDEGPSIVVEMGPEGNREAGGRRQRSGRAFAYDDDPRRGGDTPTRPRSRPRRVERGDRPRPGGGGGERFRRGGERSPTGDRGPLIDASPLIDQLAPADRPPGIDRPRPAGRPPFGDRPPIGGRPPMGDRPRGPRPPGPVDGRPGAPQHSVTDRLRQRAEQRRRDDEQREQLQTLIATTTGSDADGATFDKFLADLTQEVGALPPLERVIEAVQLANTIEPFKVGEQIRRLYRRPRPRPTALPG
jgi:hypothetical protein